MSEFKKLFDDKIKAYDAQIRALPTLTSLIPELDKKRLKLFFQRTSLLLGNIDKGKIRRPAYLAYGNGHLANYVINQLDHIPNHPGDIHGFLQNVVAPQIEFQKKLEFAVGLPGHEYEGIRQQSADEIKQQVLEVEAVSRDVLEKKNKLDELLEETGKRIEELRARVEESSLILSRAEKFRERLEKLDGDARHSDSLEKLVRTVRSKITDAEEIAKTIIPLKTQAETNSDAIEEALADSTTRAQSIVEIEKDALKVLGLASQAGLAKSYMQERKKLELNKIIYTVVFYVGIGVMAIVAAKYVLPAFETLVAPASSGNDIDVWQRALVLAIRSALLAPFVWAILFTSSRVQKIETLELDYAEKAAASLAYHGYKSEMETDSSLLERLKSGLLVRFSEHPERLLRKNPPSTEIEAGNGLFRMSSKTGPAEKPQTDRGDEAEPAATD